MCTNCEVILLVTSTIVVFDEEYIWATKEATQQEGILKGRECGVSILDVPVLESKNRDQHVQLPASVLLQVKSYINEYLL